MNLLQLLKSQLTTEKALAKITGNKGDGVWVGEKNGGVVILTGTGDYATGQYVYYDRTTGQIIAQAPSLDWQEWGV